MPAARRRRVAASTRYVVDATVAQAASSEATSGLGRQSREFLKDIYIICHRAVVSDALEAEWRLHSSRFFTMWLSWMRKRRKLAYVEGCERDDLRRAVADLDCAAQSKALMLEDIHLIEAALMTDRRIVSTDSTARALFEEYGEQLPPIDAVVWLDPSLGDRPPGRR